MAVVYSYFRHLDDLVDEPAGSLSSAEAHSVLDDWDAWLAIGAPRQESDPIRRSLPHVISRRGLDPNALRIVISGLHGDLDHRRPRSMADLERYCFQVAGSVGLVMAELLGAPMPASEAPAAAMGSAMQLTNICRDVDEDLRRGRIYLPTDLCLLAGCDDVSLQAREATRALRAAVATVADRARELYAEGMAGLGLLPPGTRFPISIAARAYATILDRLAARGYDVFAGRVSVPAGSRWAMAVRMAASRALSRA